MNEIQKIGAQCHQKSMLDFKQHFDNQQYLVHFSKVPNLDSLRCFMRISSVVFWFPHDK